MKKGVTKLKMALRRIAAAALAGCVLWCGGIQADAATPKATLWSVFDAQYYADTYPDLKETFGYNEQGLYLHFIQYGLKEGRNMNGLIDLAAYRNKYPDLDAAFGDDWDAYLNHYLTCGAQEGRDSGTEFNALDYAARYEDLQTAYGSNVLELWRHYKEFGIKENREARDEDIVQAEREAEEETSEEPETTEKPDDSQESEKEPENVDELYGITRDENGLMIRKEWENGRYCTFGYNDAGWMIQMLCYSADEELLAEIDWDDAGAFTKFAVNESYRGKHTSIVIDDKSCSILLEVYQSWGAGVSIIRYDEDGNEILRNGCGGPLYSSKDGFGYIRVGVEP